MAPDSAIPGVFEQEAIPADLRESPQWVYWRWEERNGKTTKPPYDAVTHYGAKSTDPETWHSFSQAMAAAEQRGSGVGYVLSASDDLIGIDLDHCRDAVTGEVEDWASDIVSEINSYTEVSPSGTGLRIFVRGQLPPEGRKRGNVEMYDRERYLTVTGRRLFGTSPVIERRQAQLEALHARTFPPAAPKSPHPHVVTLSRSDDDILAMAYNARNGQKFSALWKGDTSMYPSHSEADAAFVSLLAFWTQDENQIDRIFRASGLYRAKWDAKDGAMTYGQRTIVTMLSRGGERYGSRQRQTYQGGPAARAAVRHDNQIEPPRTFPLTDAGNGEMIAELYGDILRFDHLRGRWLLWQGHYWSEDDDGGVRRLAKDMARERFRRAADVDNPDEKGRIARWAVQSENRARIDAALYMASAEPPLADSGRDWDADPWALGVQNGVVDLREGTLHDGRRDERITMRTRIEFDPEADCPRWRQFLLEVFSGEGEMVEFIQRAIGYSLTGATDEQVMFLMIGMGANGKSKFQSVLRALGGGYAANSPFATFESATRGGIPNDLAALAGKRIVTCSESAEQARLNESRLKSFVHGDDTTARFLNREFFTFQPAAKLWLASNHKPRVTDDSHGFWRSVRLIPFRRSFTGQEADPALEAKLMAELPGILAWAIDGCLKWQQDGLRPPESVVIATEEYRAESDPLSEFIAAVCETGPDYTEMGGALKAAYDSWCDTSGVGMRERMGGVTFFKRLAERFDKRVTMAGKAYWGLRIRQEGA